MQGRSAAEYELLLHSPCFGLRQHHRNARPEVLRVHGFQTVFRKSVKLENDYLIGSFFQQGRRDVQSLLRSDVPIASEVESVDPQNSFIAGGNTQEGVAQFLRFERPAVE